MHETYVAKRTGVVDQYRSRISIRVCSVHHGSVEVARDGNIAASTRGRMHGSKHSSTIVSVFYSSTGTAALFLCLVLK